MTSNQPTSGTATRGGRLKPVTSACVLWTTTYLGDALDSCGSASPRPVPSTQAETPIARLVTEHFRATVG